jgi:CBS domain-containing protein
MQNDQLIGLITQADILVEVATAMLIGNDCHAMGNCVLGKLGLGVSKLISTVASSQSVAFALLQLDRWQMPALAVVDESGKLVGNFSTTDVLDIWLDRENLYATLLLSVEAYLSVHSPSAGSCTFVVVFLIAKLVASLLPVTVSARLDETLADVINCLLENRVHRLWIVDGNCKPTGVVSMTDICCLICHSGKKQ